jgi:hypothetical protein
MMLPVERASKLFKFSLEEKSGMSEFSGHECKEACEIIESDVQKAKEEAIKVANLKKQIWLHETAYTQRIKSMQKTVKYFGIGR